MPRKAIGKRLRFEVFKRDKFTCQYCGMKSPDAVLNVDHVVPVANGGTNAMQNLVTSCQGCNSGKGARQLTCRQELEKQQRELEARQDKLEQIEMQARWAKQLAKDLSVDPFVNAVNAFFEELTAHSLTKSGERNVRQWKPKLQKMGVPPDYAMKGFAAIWDKTGDWEKAFRGAIYEGRRIWLDETDPVLGRLIGDMGWRATEADMRPWERARLLEVAEEFLSQRRARRTVSLSTDQEMEAVVEFLNQRGDGYAWLRLLEEWVANPDKEEGA